MASNGLTSFLFLILEQQSLTYLLISYFQCLEVGDESCRVDLLDQRDENRGQYLLTFEFISNKQLQCKIRIQNNYESFEIKFLKNTKLLLLLGKGQSQYYFVINMLSQKFKESNCKLQLVLKDEENIYLKTARQDKSLYNTKKSTSIRWHQESPIRVVADQCLKLFDRKQFKYNDSNGFLSMMQRVITDFKVQKSKQTSIKKTKSSKKSKQKSCNSSKGQIIFETNFERNSKMQIVKKIKLKSPNFFISGQRAEQFESIRRPQSTHDLKLRLKPSRRSITARLSQNQSSSKQLTSNNSKRCLSRRSNVSSFNFKDYEQEYMKKLKLFLDFLFKVNFSNNIYIQVLLKPIHQKMLKYRIFVHKGNNDKLMKELLRRRFWYEITTSQEQCHFYWSQFDLRNRHSQQQGSKSQHSPKSEELRENNNERESSNSNGVNKSPTFKNEVKKEVTQLNNKFMLRQNSKAVQKFITKQGYIPFDAPFKFITITNHIPGTVCITAKKNLLANIKKYCQDILQENPFSIVPQSFHVESLESFQMGFFLHYASLEPKKLWIIKPSENTCRSQGIEIFPADQIKKRIRERWEEQNQTASFIIQKYIENPLLYNDRKFDIRHYMLLTCMNGSIKAYWFRQGYVRTSCEFYNLVTKINCRNPLAKKYKNQFAQQQSKWLKNRSIHFTNDIVQIQSKDYAKYEPGNKLSYTDLQKYFDYSFSEYPFFGRILPKMKQIAKKVLKSVKGKIDPQRRSCNFQLFGLDYILDEDFNVFLLEINNNPCFENNSPVLDRVIPSLLEQTIRFCVDPLLPPQNHFPANERHFLQSHSLAGLKFQLFYQQT